MASLIWSSSEGEEQFSIQFSIDLLNTNEEINKIERSSLHTKDREGPYHDTGLEVGYIH